MAAFTEEQLKKFNMPGWYDLNGKVAIVTGGATGLGLGITRCLVSAGATVCVVSRTDQQGVLDESRGTQSSTPLIFPIRSTRRSWLTVLLPSRGISIFC